MPDGTESTGTQQPDLLAGAGNDGVVAQPDSTTGNQQSAGTDVQTASSAGEGEKQPSRLDAVMAALGDRAEASPADATVGQDKDTTKPEGDAAAQDAEPAEGEDAKLPFAAHPRFKQLLAHSKERKQLRAEIEPLRTRVTELEPKAKQLDAFVDYARKSGFTQEYLSEGLRNMRLRLDDPLAYYEANRDDWAQLETMVGERLPADLQKRVNDGVLDEESARELARARSEKDWAAGKVKRVTEQTTAEREANQREAEQRQHEALVSSLQSTANAWEQQWKSSDPDYAKKQPRVQEKIELAVLKLKTTPTTDEAVAIFNKAKKEVDEDIRNLLPAPRTIRHQGSGTSVQTQGQPKDALDAAMQALERMPGR